VRGLSIVEVLVVMAVISLVLGILAPALSRARAASRSMQCQSNLKQMAAAAYSYAAIWDAFPAAIRFENDDGVLRTIAWDWVTANGHPPLPGPLWSYTTNPGEVQQCPEYDGASTFAGDPFTGYNYNTSFIGAEAVFPSLGWSNVRRGTPPSACRRACHCAMFGDGGWKSGANKFMRAPMNHENLNLAIIYAGGQAFRHQETTNIAFVDGHVGICNQPMRGVHHTETLLFQTMNYPDNGFLSDDNAAYDPR
jgi:prepilin-type processing-associated H-X9-DG protein